MNRRKFLAYSAFSALALRCSRERFATLSNSEVVESQALSFDRSAQWPGAAVTVYGHGEIEIFGRHHERGGWIWLESLSVSGQLAWQTPSTPPQGLSLSKGGDLELALVQGQGRSAPLIVPFVRYWPGA